MNVAIVTGVSRGLGEALAAALLEQGFRVLAVGRSTPGRLAGAALEPIVCDLADGAAVDSSVGGPFARAAAARPARACLINNAATAEPTGLAGALEAGEIARSIAVNLAAPFILANAFCRAFADPSIRRRIVNVSSGAAQTALPGAGLYCAAKAGLEMLTRTLAAEHAAPAFEAISVRPGIIDTPMQAYMRTRREVRLPGVAMFRGFHEEGKLVAPGTVAAKIVARLVLGEVESGRTYSYAEL